MELHRNLFIAIPIARRFHPLRRREFSAWTFELGVVVSRVRERVCFHTSTFQLLDKPWSQVSSRLPPGSCYRAQG